MGVPEQEVHLNPLGAVGAEGIQVQLQFQERTFIGHFLDGVQIGVRILADIALLRQELVIGGKILLADPQIFICGSPQLWLRVEAAADEPFQNQRPQASLLKEIPEAEKLLRPGHLHAGLVEGGLQEGGLDSAVGGGKLREGAGALADERNQVVEAGQLIQGVPVRLRELDGHLMEAAPDEGEKIFGLSFHGDLLSLVMTL